MSEDLRGQTQTILRRFAARLIDDPQSAAIASERLADTILALVEKAQALGDFDTAARLLEHFGPRIARESHLERLDACYAAVLAHEGLPGDRQVNLSGRRVQILTNLGRRAEAEAVLAAAWPYANAPLLRAHLFNRHGYLLASYEDYSSARQAYEAALKEAQSAGHRTMMGIIYNNLGEMAFSDEKYDEALSNFAKALDAAISSPEPFVRGMIEGGIAMTLDALARYDEANEHHEAARRGYQEAGDSFGLTRVDLNQAHNAVLRGDLDHAIRLASRALSQARNSGSSDQIAMAHQNLGEAYLQGGEFELAWESFAQALNLRVIMEKPLYIETTLGMIQRLLDAISDSPESPERNSLLIRCQQGVEAGKDALAPASMLLSSQPPPPPLPLPLP